ncbi:unnamed protein product [Ranitomeya imitator]|uniref:Uncharacterized protein n=1 Tax=Ranitomeya imitator TaxID=111125 RepID=A0ABN9M522_9NEOB|nr:unnamed protein product [Ranitomeya imitator]
MELSGNLICSYEGRLKGLPTTRPYLTITMNLWDQMSVPCTSPTNEAVKEAITALSPRREFLPTGHGPLIFISFNRTGNQDPILEDMDHQSRCSEESYKNRAVTQTCVKAAMMNQGCQCT